VIVQLLCLPAFDLLGLASAPWIPLLLAHFLVYLWVSLVKYLFGIVHLLIVALVLCLFHLLVLFGFLLVSSCFSDSGCRVATLLNPFTGPLLEGLSPLPHTFLWMLVPCSSSCSPGHLQREVLCDYPVVEGRLSSGQWHGSPQP